jgi:hypothetical protein
MPEWVAEVNDEGVEVLGQTPPRRLKATGLEL